VRGVTMIDDLLPKVKANLILQHDADDDLVRAYIAAALDYAREYQKVGRRRVKLSPTTELAVIMLSSHFYESRDGSTGGFFADNTAASAAVWDAANRLLAMNKNWVV
jgi:uncharacterized phage protein (predicted DNA packaging)